MLLSEMSWRAVSRAAVGGCHKPWFNGLSERSYPIIDLFFQKPQTEFFEKVRSENPSKILQMAKI